LTLVDAAGGKVRIDGTPSPVAVLASPLSSLAPYVRQTIPPTVGGGEKPLLPRPVYRAYDVGVEFNEDYVDLMYRMAGRDLGLYLFDANDRPLRDENGALVLPRSNWGRAETLTLTESEQTWIEMLDASKCTTNLTVDTTAIPHSSTLAPAIERVVLDADTLYEARLLPLLLHEDFSSYPAGAAAPGPSGQIGRWTVQDGLTSAGPSMWIFASGRVSQTTLAATSLLRDVDLGFDSAHPEQPANWTDYRFSAVVRSVGPHRIGLRFRWRDAANGYAFLAEAGGTSRLLVCVAGGALTVLAQDGEAFDLNRDYTVAVEAVGTRLRVLIDGVAVFDVSDSTHAAGTAGFTCGGNAGASFADARCEDFRSTSLPAHRFRFITSQYTNFFHHLHSFNDETWLAAIDPAADVDGALAHAVPPAAPAAEEEARAYDALAREALGVAEAQRTTGGVEIERMLRGGSTALFHVRTADPIDWSRTDLELWSSPAAGVATRVPGRVKLTGATFAGMPQPGESVTLLMREGSDLDGWRIVFRPASPDPLDPSGPGWQPWYEFGADRFSAGTVVRVTAGSVAPPAEEAVIARFVAAAPQFTSPAVDLMLLSATGAVIHARTFLSEGEYSPLDARILRRRDGTALFVAVPGMTGLSAGSYRLRWVYRRDNRGIDPESLVFSETGRRTPEVATLDFTNSLPTEGLPLPEEGGGFPPRAGL
jgi:hypothetical protein